MYTVKQIYDGLRNKSLTAVDVVEASLKVIEEKDSAVGAFLEVYADDARTRAKEIDAMIAAGEELPRLAGVPVAVKDNLCQVGKHASSGSKMLEDYVSTYNATVIDRLIAAGAILIGRVNMDEFAMGSSTETSAFQKTKNPWDLERIPGGSSGGSVAAVAAGMVPVALGSDTGGSIRQPAALCGVTGFKPTYGRVSRYGLIALASTLDQIGPITRTVEDAAMVYEVISGEDAHDATTLPSEVVPSELLSSSVAGLKIGVPKEYFIDGMDGEVRSRVLEAIEVLKTAGAEFVEVSLPLTQYSLPAYYILQPAEASSNLARFDGMRYGTRAEGGLLDSYVKARGAGFGAEVKRRIMLGTYILSAGYYDAYYKKAVAVKTAISQEFAEVFKQVDVLLTPTSPSVAWKIDEKFNDPVTMYLSDIFTTTANIAGIPAISVPCGFAQNLPVGVQFIGAYKADAKVLAVAHAYQSLTDWHSNMPS